MNPQTHAPPRAAARDDRCRVTRFVMAVWDKAARTWTVDGRTIKGYGADPTALERDIGRVLAVPDGERVRLVEASLEDGVWICVLPARTSWVISPTRSRRRARAARRSSRAARWSGAGAGGRR
jgi:hypothetical protein